MKKPELLLPAGSLPVLKTAVRFGADAVYIGGELFSLRAKAANFSNAEMKEAIEFCHAHSVRLYVTANITAHNGHLEGVKKYFGELAEMKPDALIISDPGVFRLARAYCPEIPVHISTQANNVNSETFLFWYEQGVRRVVCGRELSLEEIKAIKDAIPEDMEIEAFVHGSMCISYSGRCLLSAFMTGRDANLGACTHPCRWKYALMEETRPGEYFPVMENENGTFIFNSKDLSMIDHIPDLIAAGIDSFKVEGRMKTALYVATVGKAYRTAIDAYYDGTYDDSERLSELHDLIKLSGGRKETTGFFYGKPGSDAQLYEGDAGVRLGVYYGEIEEAFPDGTCTFTQKNKFCTGDTVMILSPDKKLTNAVVLNMWNESGEEIPSCPHPKQKIRILCDTAPSVGDILCGLGEGDQE
ncbi:MAG: U32 family peptidase [Lachnospiraceae bacterium]|nr:U32 family peptidase [Lachnospiraceae bacterium]